MVLYDFGTAKVATDTKDLAKIVIVVEPDTRLDSNIPKTARLSHESRPSRVSNEIIGNPCGFRSIDSANFINHSKLSKQ